MDEKMLNAPIMDDFLITTSRRDMDRASAVIFHLPSLSDGDCMWGAGMKRAGQLWVSWSTEPTPGRKWEKDPRYLNLFDINASYRLDSDLPIPYFYPKYFGLLRQEPIPKKGFVSAFIPHGPDLQSRGDYVKELMGLIHVDPYGRALQNISLPGDQDAATRERVMAGYKFCLTFEKAVAEDHVTDQFYHPLIAGSVPVYSGAPNVADFAPGDNCYIDVNDFPSPADLANYLMELNGDDRRFAAFLEWKTRPYKLSFNRKAIIVADHPLVRLCHILRTRLGYSKKLRPDQADTASFYGNV